MIELMVNKYETITIVVNMKSFTVTAAQRYMELIKNFCNKYLQNDLFIKRIQNIYVHNSPSVINVIRKMIHPFVKSNVSEKLIFLK